MVSGCRKVVDVKAPLSVCIICKNEALTIERCLQSVLWADEIVVLDSGSTDDTVALAKKYTPAVYFNEWPGFGLQRQKAASLAKHDWILTLDCDEVIPEKLRKEIGQHFSQNKPLKHQVFRLNRLTQFCGRFIKYSGWSPDRIVRIYNKQHTNYNSLLVHEFVSEQECEVIDLTAKFHHFNVDSWQQYTATLDRYAQDWALDRSLKNKKVNYLSASSRALFAFIRHYFLKMGFLDGKAGFLIAWGQVAYTFKKYQFLIQKNKQK